MNNIARALTPLLLAAASFATTVHAEPADALYFRNGDFVYGHLLAIDAQTVVRWRHSDAAAPIDFKPESIAQIDFPTPTNSATLTNSQCKFVMLDGDALEGDLLSCDHDAVTLQTWYAGRLQIPRHALQSLVFIPHSPAIFAGITGLEGWTQDSSAGSLPGDTGKWVYRNGAFYASKMASIARDVKLPDVAEIQFDLAWKGTLNLAVALYTDSLRPVMLNNKDNAPEFGAFYSLRMQGTALDLWPIKKLEPERRLGPIFIPSLAGMDRLHVDLRVSKPRHRFALFLDDTPVKEWDDTAGFIGQGTCLRFVQNPGGTIKLSNLRVTPWDGIFEEESAAEAPDLTHDILWNEDGTKTVGTIESIANGKLLARTTNGVVAIPLTKLRTIDFAHPQAGPTPPQGPFARATFAQGGDLTFVLESWRPDEMIVRNPDLGRLKINPAAFTRLLFVPADRKPAEPKS